MPRQRFTRTDSGVNSIQDVIGPNGKQLVVGAIGPGTGPMIGAIARSAARAMSLGSTRSAPAGWRVSYVPSHSIVHVGGVNGINARD